MVPNVSPRGQEERVVPFFLGVVPEPVNGRVEAENLGGDLSSE